MLTKSRPCLGGTRKSEERLDRKKEEPFWWTFCACICAIILCVFVMYNQCARIGKRFQPVCGGRGGAARFRCDSRDHNSRRGTLGRPRCQSSHLTTHQARIPSACPAPDLRTSIFAAEKRLHAHMIPVHIPFRLEDPRGPVEKESLIKNNMRRTCAQRSACARRGHKSARGRYRRRRLLPSSRRRRPKAKGHRSTYTYLSDVMPIHYAA